MSEDDAEAARSHITKDQPKTVVFSGNPHMTNEWFGRFHDDDWESWNAYPEALKATGHKARPWNAAERWQGWQ